MTAMKVSAKSRKKMVTVIYTGPLGRVSVPGRQREYVNNGERVEVLADLILNAHWRVIEDTKKEAPTKDGE